MAFGGVVRVSSFIFAFFTLAACQISISQNIKFNFPEFNAQPGCKVGLSHAEKHDFQNNYSFSRIYVATKRPMFCRMEDNLHKRFNVWIVFRVGTDNDYKKLTSTKRG